MENEHFSHPDHPFVLINEVLEYIGEEVICSWCEEPISGPCYSCTSCCFFLHKKCFELPREIRRHLHPQHPLYLLAKPPPHCGRCTCDLCNKTCKSFVYHCSLCQFDLDIKCALPPCIFEAEGQGHNFICLIKSISLKSTSFTCNACGTDGDDSPFVCTMCQLVVHEKCLSLPRTIKTILHYHPQIIHTYHLQQGTKAVKKYCGICRGVVDTEYGVYYCPDCDFVAHVNCGITYGDSSTATEEDENEEEQSMTVNDQCMEPSFFIVSETKHGEEKVIAEIKHFSHQHNLILIDKVDDDIKCDGCMLPISAPFYSCARCNFFLDKTCIELPKWKKWQYHKHPMILLWEDDMFECIVCQQYCHGLNYSCNRCEGSIDIRCFKLFIDSIKHRGHEHPLFLSLDRQNSECSCNGCGVAEDPDLFRCVDCDFNLEIRCVNLPYKARHEYDEHPLFLTYTDPNDYQYVCQICEKERDPKLWFYRCEECDFDAHPECAIGKNPYVKLGGSYTYDFHPHPLALVEKTEDYPACHACGEPCDDLALECTHSQCSFIIHKKSPVCFLITHQDF